MNGRIPVGLDASGTPEAPGSKPAVLTRVVVGQRASRFGTHHLRLVREPDAELLLDPSPHLLCQPQQIRARAAEIHERQRVPGRDPRPAPAPPPAPTPPSPGKPRPPDQPPGRAPHPPPRPK